MSIKSPLSELGRMYADPYEYITDDADLWLQLFVAASEKDRYLYGILIYLRGVGANLVSTGNPKMPYKIVPIIDKDKGWSCMEEWEREKKHLNPYINTLVELIRGLS